MTTRHSCSPKGRKDLGKYVPATAVRETSQETGQLANPGLIIPALAPGRAGQLHGRPPRGLQTLESTRCTPYIVCFKPVPSTRLVFALVHQGFTNPRIIIARLSILRSGDIRRMSEIEKGEEGKGEARVRAMRCRWSKVCVALGASRGRC